MSKKHKKKKSPSRVFKKGQRYLFLIPMFVFTLQTLIALRIEGFDWYGIGKGNLVVGLGMMLDNNYVPPNSWLGADGESYLRGLQGLERDGFFSTEGTLSYWPAGYPILLWAFLKLFGGFFFLAISTFQSLVFCACCIFFTLELSKTRLTKFTLPTLLILVFNPTLVFSAMSIGYESLTASLVMLSVTCALRIYRNSHFRQRPIDVLTLSTSMFLMILMQPRFILFAILVGILLVFFTSRRKQMLFVLVFVLISTSLAPLLLITRNYVANDLTVISTNLGTTMSIGAGPGADGGYGVGSIHIGCPESEGLDNAAEADSKRVKCVLRWYLENPQMSLILFWNKAKFFWSPWFGPEANGTMARNPWRINHPFNSIVGTPGGERLVYGAFGQIVSGVWMLSSLALIGLGFSFLWRLDGTERVFAALLVSLVVTNMLTSMLTIGDHRFRIPTMGLSLTLQAIGIFCLSRRNRHYAYRVLGTPR